MTIQFYITVLFKFTMIVIVSKRTYEALTTIIKTINCHFSHVCRRWMNKRIYFDINNILLNLLSPPSPSKLLENNKPSMGLNREYKIIKFKMRLTW